MHAGISCLKLFIKDVVLWSTWTMHAGVSCTVTRVLGTASGQWQSVRHGNKVIMSGLGCTGALGLPLGSLWARLGSHHCCHQTLGCKFSHEFSQKANTAHVKSKICCASRMHKKSLLLGEDQIKRVKTTK